MLSFEKLDLWKLTPLEQAVYKGETHIAKDLIAGGADGDFDLLMRVAIQNNNVDIAELLIHNGADLDVKHYDNYNNGTLVHIAAIRGRVEILKALIAGGADINKVNDDGETPLHAVVTIRFGNLEIIKLLINSGAALDTVARNGETALMGVLLNGAHDSSKIYTVVNYIVDNGADVHVTDKIGRTPLHYAMRHDVEGIASILIHNGADVNVTDKYGQTPLHYAVTRRGHCTCPDLTDNLTRLLIANGADVNIADKDGLTPLNAAVKKETLRSELFKILTVNGANVNKGDQYGRTPMHFAMTHAVEDIAEILLDNDAKVNSVDCRGLTPLHFVLRRIVENGDVDFWVIIKLMEQLIDNGANLNIADKNGLTPLQQAVRDQAKRSKLFKILIVNGANVDAESDRYLREHIFVNKSPSESPFF